MLSKIRPGFALVLFLFVAAAGAPLPAQEASVAERLAAALRAEETRPSAEETLALFRALAAVEDLTEEQRWQVGQGIVRGLTRLGRLDEAQHELETLSAAADGDPRRAGELEALRRRLAQRRAEQDGEPVTEAEVALMQRLLEQGEFDEVGFLGDRALPVAVALLERRADKLSAVTIGLAIDRILAAGDERSVASLVRLYPGLDRNARVEILNRARSHSLDWKPLIELALADAEPSCRERALSFSFHRVPDVGIAILEKVLADPIDVVRSRAFDVAFNHGRYLLGFDAEDLVRRALEDPLPKIRRLVFRGYTDVQPVLSRNPEVFFRGMDDPDAEVRAQAYRGFTGVVPRSRARDRIIEGLADPEIGIRLLCLDYLGNAVEVADVAALRPLLADSDPQVSAKSAAVLSRLPARALCEDPEREGFFLRLLDAPGQGVRNLACSVLARVGGPDHGEAMAELIYSEDENMRQNALYYLVRHDRKESAELVVSQLSRLRGVGVPGSTAGFRQDPAVRGRFHAEWVLNWFADRGHVQAFERLLEQPESVHVRSNEVRRALVAAVRRLLSDRRQPWLVERLRAFEGSAQVFVDLEDWFPRSPWFEDVCFEILESAAPNERGLVGGLVADRATRRSAARLLDLLVAEDHPAVARVLAAALARVAGPEEVEAMAARLAGRPDARAGGNVITALGLVGSPEAAQVLLDALEEDRLELPELRGAALSALVAARHPQAAPVARAAIRSHRDTVRSDDHQDLQLLGVGGEERAPEGWRFYIGLVVLHGLGGASFLEEVETLFRSDGVSEDVLGQALELLAVSPGLDAKGREARRLLIEGALGHPSARVRRAGIRAAAHLLMKPLAGRLRDALSDPETKAAANMALRRLAELSGALTGD